MNTHSCLRLSFPLVASLILNACSPPPGDAAMCQNENLTGLTNSITISEGGRATGRAGDLREVSSSPTDGVSFLQDSRTDEQFFEDSSYTEHGISIMFSDGTVPMAGQVLQLGHDFTILSARSYPASGPYEYPSELGVSHPLGDMTLTIVNATTWILDGDACAEASSNFTHAGYVHAVRLVLHPW